MPPVWFSGSISTVSAAVISGFPFGFLDTQMRFALGTFLPLPRNPLSLLLSYNYTNH